MKQLFLKKEPRIPFTKEGYQKLIEEKASLTAQRPDAVEHLRLARNMGDLSENGYYKASRQKLSFIDSRIRRVERLIRLAVIVESTHGGMVDIGSVVTVSDGTNTSQYSIVGGYESDPSKKTISHISPLGKALMSKKQNDVVEVRAPSGIKKYRILIIS
ncbi:MAG TPA: transcription elongation factor GreA [Patescibacteria group bacterium]|jgi:transcription elongation factor GreA|nr:transcription elongation factor GreA [Patescibacteria group bacterium]